MLGAKYEDRQRARSLALRVSQLRGNTSSLFPLPFSTHCVPSQEPGANIHSTGGRGIPAVNRASRFPGTRGWVMGRNLLRNKEMGQHRQREGLCWESGPQRGAVTLRVGVGLPSSVAAKEGRESGDGTN